jgi:hypothetical protein
MKKHLPIVLSLAVPVLALAAIQYIPVFRPVYRWMCSHALITLGVIVLSGLPFAVMAYNQILGNFFHRSVR